MTIDPNELLAGPRGRRLCLALAAMAGERGGAGETDDLRAAEELRVAVTWAAYDLDPGRGTSRVVLAFADATGTEEPEVPRPSTADVARLLGAVPLSAPGPRALLDSLATAVDFARYWQEPDGEDVLAAAPEVRAALARVAHVVSGAEAAAWWTSPVARSDQWSVTFTDGPPAPPPETVAGRLARWRHAAAEEARAALERPHDPSASWSGTWWSTPPSDLRRTTRGLTGLGPAGLWLVEDSGGWDEATTRAVTVPQDVTVFEVDGPSAWAELCRRYPLEVTASRRHDWYRTTGQDFRWVQPDWSRVADDVDAVHLTVAGYLTTAGRSIPVTDDLRTVLAGWNPDETFWLTDRVTPAAEEHGWSRDHDGGWRVVPPPR